MKFFKWFVVALGMIALLSFVYGVAWRYSGSNQWKLVGERNGVTVFYLKAPGLDIVQVRGVIRARTTLSRLVMFMQDPDVCDDVGCYQSRTIEYVDEQLQYNSFRFDVPFGKSPREFVVRTQFYQHPESKQVVAQFTAVPDRIPFDSCCLRITRMNNTWRFTPLEEGMVEVEYTIDMDEAGYLPKFMLNFGHRELAFEVLPHIERWANRDKYQNAKFSFLTE